MEGKDKKVIGEKEAADFEAKMKKKQLEARIPPIHNYTMDLSNLTDQEEKVLVDVLEKDAAFLSAVDGKLIDLRREIQDIRIKGVIQPGDKQHKICARCKYKFWTYLCPFSDHGKQCINCRFKVCKQCRTQQVNKTWICSLCLKQRQERQLSGTWMHKGQCLGLAGSDLLKASLRDREFYKGLRHQKMKRKIMDNALLEMKRNSLKKRKKGDSLKGGKKKGKRKKTSVSLPAAPKSILKDAPPAEGDAGNEGSESKKDKKKKKDDKKEKKGDKKEGKDKKKSKDSKSDKGKDEGGSKKDKKSSKKSKESSKKSKDSKGSQKDKNANAVNGDRNKSHSILKSSSPWKAVAKSGSQTIQNLQNFHPKNSIDLGQSGKSLTSNLICDTKHKRHTPRTRILLDCPLNARSGESGCKIKDQHHGEEKLPDRSKVEAHAKEAEYQTEEYVYKHGQLYQGNTKSTLLGDGNKNIFKDIPVKKDISENTKTLISNKLNNLSVDNSVKQRHSVPIYTRQKNPVSSSAHINVNLRKKRGTIKSMSNLYKPFQQRFSRFTNSRQQKLPSVSLGHLNVKQAEELSPHFVRTSAGDLRLNATSEVGSIQSSKEKPVRANKQMQNIGSSQKNSGRRGDELRLAQVGDMCAGDSLRDGLNLKISPTDQAQGKTVNSVPAQNKAGFKVAETKEQSDTIGEGFDVNVNFQYKQSAEPKKPKGTPPPVKKTQKKRVEKAPGINMADLAKNLGPKQGDEEGEPGMEESQLGSLDSSRRPRRVQRVCTIQSANPVQISNKRRKETRSIKPFKTIAKIKSTKKTKESSKRFPQQRGSDKKKKRKNNRFLLSILQIFYRIRERILKNNSFDLNVIQIS